MRKIKNFDGFKEFIGKEMYDLWKAMPECFERNELESGRQVFTHIYDGTHIEVLHDGWGIITNIRKF